jgi:hypothetical protein
LQGRHVLQEDDVEIRVPASVLPEQNQPNDVTEIKSLVRCFEMMEHQKILSHVKALGELMTVQTYCDFARSASKSIDKLKNHVYLTEKKCVWGSKKLKEIV